MVDKAIIKDGLYETHIFSKLVQIPKISVELILWTLTAEVQCHLLYLHVPST